MGLPAYSVRCVNYHKLLELAKIFHLCCFIDLPPFSLLIKEIRIKRPWVSLTADLKLSFDDWPHCQVVKVWKLKGRPTSDLSMSLLAYEGLTAQPSIRVRWGPKIPYQYIMSNSAIINRIHLVNVLKDSQSVPFSVDMFVFANNVNYEIIKRTEINIMWCKFM